MWKKLLPAAAQVARTWTSGVRDDAYPCSRHFKTAPGRRSTPLMPADLAR